MEFGLDFYFTFHKMCSSIIKKKTGFVDNALHYVTGEPSDGQELNIN